MKLKLVHIPYIIIAALLIWIMVQKAVSNHKIKEITRQVELADSTTQVLNDTYAKLQLTSSNNAIQSEMINKSLKDLIKSKDEKIVEYQKIIVKQKQTIFALQQGVVVDTVIDSVSQRLVQIDGYVKPYTVKGDVYCNDGRWNMSIDRDPFSLECVIVQTKTGAIKKLYVSTNDSTLTIENLTYKTVPASTSFFSRFSIFAGLGYSRKAGPSILGGIGISRYLFGGQAYQGEIGGFIIRRF